MKAAGDYGSRRPGRLRTLLAFVAIATFATGAMATKAAADTVEIYAAGSLRGAVEALTKELAADAGIDIKAEFGGSGSLRQRIEGGEHPDLFLSADMDSPRKLAAAGRTVVPPVAFARNRMCLVAQRSAGVTPENLVDRMLAEDLRLRTSTPIVDPAGDYAMAIFDRIDARHPGAGKILRDKAQRVADAEKSAAPPAGLSGIASLFRNNRIDMMVTYCSVRTMIEGEVPDLATVVFPPELEPKPVYGMAVLSDKPSAMRLALIILSEKGQAIIAKAGLLPVFDTGP